MHTPTRASPTKDMKEVHFVTNLFGECLTGDALDLGSEHCRVLSFFRQNIVCVFCFFPHSLCPGAAGLSIKAPVKIKNQTGGVQRDDVGVTSCGQLANLEDSSGLWRTTLSWTFQQLNVVRASGLPDIILSVENEATPY